jgi:hypothetical protein
MMLSALDLARRIETGELTPAAVIELCALRSFLRRR